MLIICSYALNLSTTYQQEITTMNRELFRHNYKKQHGSTKNATKAWKRFQHREVKSIRTRLRQRFEDSLQHDQDPRERI